MPKTQTVKVGHNKYTKVIKYENGSVYEAIYSHTTKTLYSTKDGVEVHKKSGVTEDEFNKMLEASETYCMFKGINYKVIKDGRIDEEFET